MNSNRRRLLASTVAVVSLTLGTTSVAHAGRANPQQGYMSVLHNLADKGVNHGRCVAVAVLAEKILLSGEALPILVPVEIADACDSQDVYLGDHIIEETVEEEGE